MPVYSNGTLTVNLYPKEEDAAAFAKHFDDQISTYANNGDGQVVAISLAEKQGREKVRNLCTRWHIWSDSWLG